MDWGDNLSSKEHSSQAWEYLSSNYRSHIESARHPHLPPRSTLASFPITPYFWWNSPYLVRVPHQSTSRFSWGPTFLAPLTPPVQPMLCSHWDLSTYIHPHRTLSPASINHLHPQTSHIPSFPGQTWWVALTSSPMPFPQSARVSLGPTTHQPRLVSPAWLTEEL